MTLKDIGEFGLIETIKDSFKAPEGVLGIGDDCAVIPQSEGMETLVSTDMLVEGTHFLMDEIDPWQLGWKSAAVNLSDIAAMGGRPTGTFLSLALPDGLDTRWMREFIRGFKDISDKYGAPLLGGDTTASKDRVVINVTVMGECAKGRSKKRSSAKAGDLICVTGCLGDSACGLRCILEKPEPDGDTDTLISRHYLPEPRVNEGLKLSAIEGVHSMMDISDGIGSDLRHILKASGCGAEIDVKSIPLSPSLERVCAHLGWDSLELAVSGGEDYELLFTVSPEAEKTLPVQHTVIGKITASSGISWEGGDKDYFGYRQF